MSNEMIWIIAGCLLMLSEFFIPGFVIFFFGAGAILTGFAQMIFPTGAAGQFTVFLACSLILLFVLRRFLPQTFSGIRQAEAPLPREEEEFAGEIAVVSEEITPEHPGKITFHGSLWRAESDQICRAGETVRITCRKNLTFTVSKEK